jgi:hypothetical protein
VHLCKKLTGEKTSLRRTADAIIMGKYLREIIGRKRSDTMLHVSEKLIAVILQNKTYWRKDQPHFPKQ